jgi:hypothetical protein
MAQGTWGQRSCVYWHCYPVDRLIACHLSEQYYDVKDCHLCKLVHISESQFSDRSATAIYECRITLYFRLVGSSASYYWGPGFECLRKDRLVWRFPWFCSAPADVYWSERNLGLRSSASVPVPYPLILSVNAVLMYWKQH